MMFVRRKETPLHPRGSSGPSVRPARGAVLRAAALAILVTAAAAGCTKSHAAGPTSPNPAASYVRSCGTARTAANVPVQVEVASGNISCGTAKAVELAYAKAIRSGLAPGNGGGGPVKVMGWTCQGFATPIVLQTGKASKCTQGGSEILEILPPLPSPAASS
jgi:hypothetical protein